MKGSMIRGRGEELRSGFDGYPINEDPRRLPQTLQLTSTQSRAKRIRRDLSRRILLSTARALSDVDLSRRVERSGNAAARVDAAFIVRRRRCSAGSRRATYRGANHRRLRAAAKYLAGDRTNCGATDDLLHVLTLRLVLDLAHLRVARRRAHGISVSAEVYRYDAKAHHDVVVGVLAPL